MSNARACAFKTRVGVAKRGASATKAVRETARAMVPVVTVAKSVRVVLEATRQ